MFFFRCGFIAGEILLILRMTIDYVTVVMGAIVLYAIVYWFVRARRTFSGVSRVLEREPEVVEEKL